MGRVEPVERTGLRHLVPYFILLCVCFQTESVAIRSPSALSATLSPPLPFPERRPCCSWWVIALVEGGWLPNGYRRRAASKEERVATERRGALVPNLPPLITKRGVGPSWRGDSRGP